MLKNFFLVSFLVVLASSLFANISSGNDSPENKPLIVQHIIANNMANPWVKQVGLQYSMPILAKVYKNGLLFQPVGSLLGVFKDNLCWGFGGLGNSPVGQLYNITTGYNTNNISGFTYKVYDPTTEKIYDLAETVTFKSNIPVGAINAPVSLNVKFNITAISSDITKGTVTGSVGTFSSGQSVNVIATPLAGYRFVNWTDGVGGTVISTNADYTFTANESRNLIANFDILPVVTVTSNLNSSTIPSADITDVIISSDGILAIDAPVAFKSLTIQNGGRIILPTAKSLTISGDFLLKSDAANGTSTLTDLNVNGGFTVNGTTTVQQYLTGSGGATPNGRFWYIGTPVEGATSAVFDAAGNNQLWYYDESAHTYVEITDNNTPLVVGRGYVVRLGENTTVNFTGILVTGNKAINLTNNSGHEKSGYNLIVNPYPSFVNLKTVLTGIGSRTIWTRSVNAQSIMVFDTYNYGLNTGVSASGITPTSFIAPMQAFWVKLSNDATSSISFNNTVRSQRDSTILTNRLKAPAQINNDQKLLRLKVSNGTNSDETVLAFNTDALNSFDEFDSPKMSNTNVVVPEIYTIANGTKLAINGMNAYLFDQELELGFNTGQSNTFSIKATEVSNFDEDTKIILQDNLLNEKIELVNDAEYAFTSDITSSSTRFSILFKSASVTTNLNDGSEDKHASVSNYINGQITVNLSNLEDNNTRIILLNGLGQKLETLYSTSTSIVINKQLKSGIYFVNVNVSGVNTTKKLIVE